MVTIAHVSDTHLGRRPDDVRDMLIDRKYRPLEDDFYRAWKLAVKEILDRKDEVDIVVHSGDLFDSPYALNPYPPPEAARNVAAEAFQELKKANIPVVIIDGNHGCYTGYRISTLDHYAIIFDNVHAFTYWDFAAAFKRGEQLKKRFDGLTVYCYPYVDPKFLETAEVIDRYRQWIRSVKLERRGVNVAVAHGMQADGTLDPNLLNMEFDYIALGHDHNPKRITRNAAYAGSTERWSFKESDVPRQFLLVNVEPRNEPEITPVEIPQRRPMINETVHIEAEDTAYDITEKMRRILQENGLETPYNYDDAARVKITLEGATSHETLTRLYAALEEFKHEALTSQNINVVQLKVGRASPERIGLKPTPTYQEIEYLIEDPEEDIRRFLQKKEIGETYDIDLMVKIFKEALKELEGEE